MTSVRFLGLVSLLCGWTFVGAATQKPAPPPPPPLSANALDFLVGNWQGTLTYLDQRDNKSRNTIKATLDVARVGENCGTNSRPSIQTAPRPQESRRSCPLVRPTRCASARKTGGSCPRAVAPGGAARRCGLAVRHRQRQAGADRTDLHARRLDPACSDGSSSGRAGPPHHPERIRVDGDRRRRESRALGDGSRRALCGTITRSHRPPQPVRRRGKDRRCRGRRRPRRQARVPRSRRRAGSRVACADDDAVAVPDLLDDQAGYGSRGHDAASKRGASGSMIRSRSTSPSSVRFGSSVRPARFHGRQRAASPSRICCCTPQASVTEHLSCIAPRRFGRARCR